MKFEFATTARIVFGAGTVKQIGALASAYGTRALVVTGWTADKTGFLLELLGSAGVSAQIVEVAGEPTTHHVHAAASMAR
jgi:alcohol dehydrogenase